MTTMALPSPLDVFRARRRLRAYLRPSPLIHSRWLSTLTESWCERHVDRLTSVSEEDLVTAIRGLAAEEHLIAEGAGAAATAAVLTRKVVGKGQRAAVLLSGSNIDLEVFARVVGGSGG
jgi:threonine dehydratase